MRLHYNTSRAQDFDSTSRRCARLACCRHCEFVCAQCSSQSPAELKAAQHQAGCIFNINFAGRDQWAWLRRRCSGPVIRPRMLLLCQRRALPLLCSQVSRRRVTCRLQREAPLADDALRSRSAPIPLDGRISSQWRVPSTCNLAPAGPGAFRAAAAALFPQRRILLGCWQPRQPRSAPIRGSAGGSVKCG